jgi:transposase
MRMGIKAYSFYIEIKDLNKQKYQHFLNRAHEIRDFKNFISDKVFANLEYFLNLTEYNWYSMFTSTQVYCTKNDDQKAITDVYTSYKRHYEKFIFREKTKIQHFYDKEHSKIHKKSTRLTSIVSFLLRYYSGKLFSITGGVEAKQFKTEVNEALKKYGQRILTLVEEKRRRIIKESITESLKFVSLNFRSINELKMPMIQRSKNNNSKYGAKIIFGGQKVPKRGNVSGSKGKIIIPVKYNSSYHGDLKDFDKSDKKGYHKISHLVCFEKDVMRFVFWKDCIDKSIPTKKTNILGVDINLKNNLFTTSSNHKICYEEELLSSYFKFLTSLDKKRAYCKNNNLPFKYSQKERVGHKRWSTRITDMMERKCSALIKYCKENSFDHLVLESLDLRNRITSRSETHSNFTYSRLIHILHIVGIKEIITRLSHKNDIQITFVQPQYTSICCNKCYTISNQNRKAQETFVCVECGNKTNADFNAALNIKDRVDVDVLRNSLLSDSNDGYLLKIKSNDEIYRIIHEHKSFLTKT